MDIKQLLFLVVLSVGYFSGVWAQSAYYVTAEGQRIEKVRLKNQGPLLNAKECLQLLNEMERITFLPQQLQEYGFNLAQVYHSKMIIIDDEPTQVFLKVLVDGKMRLYFHTSKWGKRFFLENEEGGLVEIEEFDLNDDSYNFKDALRSLCRDCVEAVDVVDQVKFTQASLARFVEKYNACDERPLPSFRYGVFGGWNLSTLAASHAVMLPILLESTFGYNGNAMVGAFVDVPLPARNLHLHLEGYYSSGDYWYEKITDNYDTDVVANLKAITIPILLRYTSPRREIRPFFDAGIFIARYTHNNSGIQQSALLNGDTIDTYIINEDPIFDNTQIGVALGGGVEVELGKLSVFGEARIQNYSIWVPTKQRLYRREIFFVAGIMF